MRVIRSALVASAVSALALIGAGTAPAAPQGPWVLPAVPISVPATIPGTEQPRMAVAPDGSATAVWRRQEGSDWILQAATRPAGAEAFGSPVNISLPGAEAALPDIAAGPDSGVVVVWRRVTGGSGTVEMASRPPGGGFTAPVTLSDPARNASTPQVAIAPDGTATVIWRQSNGTLFEVQAATRPAGAHFFGAPERVSTAGKPTLSPRVAAAADGTVTGVWTCQCGSGPEWMVESATRPAEDNFFADPITLSAPGHETAEPQLAFSGDGRLTVIWRGLNTGTWVAETVTRPPGGTFTAPAQRTPTDRNIDLPRIAAAPGGRVVAIWRRELDDSKYEVQAISGSTGAGFGLPVTISSPDYQVWEPALTVSPDGTFTALWRLGGLPPQWIQASLMPPGGSFETPVDLTNPAGSATYPAAAAAPDGRVTAAWLQQESGMRTLWAASTTQPLPLTVTTTGKGSGTVSSNPAGIDCGSRCGESFLPGTVVTLTATPKSGSTFAGWSGACVGTSPKCRVTMNEAREVTATFARVPVNPSNDSTAIYDNATGRLKIRLKCGPQYRPKCLTMLARAVVGKTKRAKEMSNATITRKVKAGKWKLTTLKIKPKFRAEVRKMGQKSAKTLWTRITVTWKKKGKKQVRTVHHRYRVMVRQ